MRKNWSIKTSIIGLFIALLGVTIILLVSFSSVNTKNKMYEQMTIQGIQLGNQIRANLESEQAVIDADALTTIGDNKTVEAILKYLGTDDSIIYVGILDAQDKVISHSEDSRVGNVYAGTFEDSTIQANQTKAAMYFDEESGNNALSLTLPIRNGSNDIIGVLALGLSVKSVDAAIRMTIIQSIMIGFFIFIIATIILSFYLNHLMLPVIRLKETTEKAAGGTFEKPLEINQNNEIGALSDAFNIMITDIKSMIDKTVSSIGDTSVASSELSDIARVSKDISDNMLGIINDLSQGAEGQMVQTAAVKKNMDDMNFNTELIISELEKFRVTMDLMIGISENSEKDMAFMDRQIENISITSKNSGDTVKQLVRSTDKIFQIVDVINNIAKQTNLIALNAAIEASRAGEHGKGFSVVAEEIRKLANESLIAVNNITEIVRENQRMSHETIASIDNTIEQSEKGSEVAVNVKEAFNSMQSSIEKATEQFKLLISSSNLLTKSSREVSDSVERIQVVSEGVLKSTKEATQWTKQQNDSIHEILHNVANLEAIADSMRSIVEKYKA